ncbi:Gfo/Idh/MocA family protein [Natronocalculus amylovorans]|uniref:Gfo/Idh/MocA family oxidoreductase n=1 Tax=Natronocalculus amylovorans TaxID=2917812 RepID=A0AAE3K983_9EURY|nr:Gfo/Idh/MocA family oxidoreductase [Natronocalculus amylovorans]MCL9818097.1 Gfo/Idh/MocA family oxidoreductase [Natronocalculus amylovorans]NUE03908.1 Gfo/Idh/MocA family oxidoreductase [Halorubraceae archaeon YAN]
MVAETLSAGVIGVGSMGRHHARVYHELPDVILSGVTDVDYESAKTVAETYRTRSKSVSGLLRDVDLVSIAVPTQYHYQAAMEAIEAGVHVLIEKPIAETATQAKKLVRAAENAGVTLQVGHVERFNPAVQTVMDIIPELEIIAIDAQRLGPPVGREIQDSAAVDLMIHDLDIITSLVDEPVETVSAAETAAEQYVTATLTFESGIIGTLTASRVTQQKVRELSITAKECRVNVDYVSQSVTISRQSIPEYVESDGQVKYRHSNVIERPTVENGEPLRHELESFVSAIRSNGSPVVSGEDGLRALSLAQRVESNSLQTVEQAR